MCTREVSGRREDVSSLSAIVCRRGIHVTVRELEVRAALDLVWECRAVHDTVSLAKLIVARLPVVVPADSCSWNEVSPRTGQIAVVSDPDLLFPGGEELLARHAPAHPVIAHFQFCGDRRALMISDFISQRELHNLGLYQEVYRSLGIENQLSFTTPLPDGGFVGIALNRGVAGFNEHDRVLVDMLRPFVSQAISAAACARADGVSPIKGLSPREEQVLRLVADGATNIEVARTLSISPRTVQKHLSSIYSTLGVRSRTAAVAALSGRRPGGQMAH
jgi:DNA-binding CsgD family transcriptional regulator